MSSCLCHILFLFLSLNCSCNLLGFHFNAPVCDRSHKLQEDMTCQNPITPFMFLLAQPHAAQTVSPFNFFFSSGKYRMQIASCLLFQRDKKHTVYQFQKPRRCCEGTQLVRHLQPFVQKWFLRQTCDLVSHHEIVSKAQFERICHAPVYLCRKTVNVMT